MQKTQLHSLGQEDPLEKEVATNSSNLAWEIPWTEEPGGLQSTRSQRVGHDSAAEQGHVQPIVGPFLCIPLIPEQDSYQAFTSLGYVWLSSQAAVSCPVGRDLPFCISSTWLLA